MRFKFKPSFSRAIALFGLLGLGLAQVGCAHPVVVEPSVSVHSRIGHFPVYAQVGVPGPVVYALPPRVVYAPPPRVVYLPGGYAPRVYAPVHGWGHGHDGRQRGHEPRGHESRNDRQDDGGRGRGGWDHRDDGHR
ncbi:hypothetical protein [Limnohabitans sp. 2KL-17]|uniref:hypothetical protein n=1 Tax=Limnohabitans sp. 2KL-17 TaxID=1100704 RepID=UPI000D34C04B|nr:hypothetical protein [Limnohabitans sp. 2KL-17]